MLEFTENLAASLCGGDNTAETSVDHRLDLAAVDGCDYSDNPLN
jgi:hypothetical protein